MTQPQELSAQTENPPCADAELDPRLQALCAHPNVCRGMAFLKADADRTLDWQMAVTAVPAPPFTEAERATFVQSAFAREGLADVQTDAAGNVLGHLPGQGDGPRCVVSAHLDTVFPPGVDTRPVWRDGRIHAPGIADDGRGLAVLWTLLRCLKTVPLPLQGQLRFCATVGEEGPGDLRGVKHLFATQPDIDGFISIEPGAPDRVTFRGTGSKRYRASFRGPGGHSSGAFGTPSAIHAMGRAIARLAENRPPKTPRTTFTVGTVTGGTSVNTIAADAAMEVDIRSVDPAALADLEARMVAQIHAAAAEENARWDKASLHVQLEQIGDRPCGAQRADAAIVRAALAAARAMGIKPKLSPPGSTDCNIPIHLGIPAVTLGGGGKAAKLHTLEESFDPTDAYLGAQRIYLTLLALLGVADLCPSLLPRRSPPQAAQQPKPATGPQRRQRHPARAKVADAR